MGDVQITTETDNGHEEPPETLPRKRGRPKGSPKVPGSGRKKGTKNWTNSEIRDALLGRSGAIDVLADIVAGRQLYAGASGSVGKPGWRYPTLQQRLQALQILLAKVVPDLKAQELSGADGKPLFPDGREATSLDVALAIMAIFQDEGIELNSDPLANAATAALTEVSGTTTGVSDASPDIAMGGPVTRRCVWI